MTKPRKGYDGWRDGKGQIGIDGNKDSDFGRKYAVDPWDSNPKGNRNTNGGKSAYTSNDVNFLRDTGTDPESYAKIDVFDMVENQSDKTGPVVLRKRDR
jgi:hypothetical protein